MTRGSLSALGVPENTPDLTHRFASRAEQRRTEWLKKQQQEEKQQHPNDKRE
jgi:hypothetical protein